jgi:hypothetical protein
VVRLGSGVLEVWIVHVHGIYGIQVVMQLEADMGKPEEDSKRKRRFVMAYEALYNVPEGRA